MEKSALAVLPEDIDSNEPVRAEEGDELALDALSEEEGEAEAEDAETGTEDGEEEESGCVSRYSMDVYMRLLHRPDCQPLGEEQEGQLGKILLAFQEDACELLCGCLGQSASPFLDAKKRTLLEDAAVRIAQGEKWQAIARGKEQQLGPLPDPGDYLAAVMEEIRSRNQREYFSLFGMTSAVRAYDRMFKSNLRLVVSIARHFKMRNWRAQYVDLIQSGNIGLMDAVARFDQRRGYRFSTYAMWWIRHYMRRFAYEKDRLIALPIHLQEEYGRLKMIGRRRGTDGLDEETIREAYGLEPEDRKRIDRSVAVMTTVKAAVSGPISLDRSFRADMGEHGLIDILHDPDDPDAEKALIEASRNREVHRLIGEVLKPIEERVLRRRFGLGGSGSGEMTLAEIGALENLTRERIRQIQMNALRKLAKHVLRLDL